MHPRDLPKLTWVNDPRHRATVAVKRETPPRRPRIRPWMIKVVAGLGAVAIGASGLAAWLNRVTPAQIAEGRELFTHTWSPHDALAGEGDGLGPVFNARSCAECHNQGGVGGAGDNRFNVQAFQALPTSGRPQSTGGVIHAFAIEGEKRESESALRLIFPIVRGGQRVVNHCTYRVPDFDPLRIDSINTPALFGSGAIDELSDWSIRSAAMTRSLGNVSRELSMELDNTPSGRVRVLPDGRIGKFGWKGQFATLEEFVAAACAMELGLSNSLKSQPTPRRHEENREAKPDLDARQLRAMVSYVRSLPTPMVNSNGDAAVGRKGQGVFASIGCADCHTPDLGHLCGVYTDFCLYDLDDIPGGDYGDGPPEGAPSDEPQPAEWKTPPLWGVADSAPYMHDGSAATLDEAIAQHGGAAKGVRDRFKQLPEGDREAVVAFLKTLRAPVAAE